MFKRTISTIIIISVLSLIWYSCSENSINQPAAKPEGPTGVETDNLNKKLINDPQVKELVDICDELIQTVIDRKITREELESAALDKQIAAAELGMSGIESERLIDHIKELSNSLLMKYPELKEMVQKQMKERCESCQISQVISNWDKVRADQDQDSRRGLLSKMSYTTYIVALIGCAVGTGGNALFYAICAYVVYCSYTGKC